MKIAVLVVSRNRPHLVRNLAGWLERNMSLDYDLIVVEAGTEHEQLSEYSTLHYPDEDFRGKCFAHDVALKHAQRQTEGATPYDYYWVLMNDLVFEEGSDAARVLVEAMQREPRLAILSPTCRDGQYPSSARAEGGGWRAVTTCDYLGFMLRARAVREVGFLNPDFRYCWGAIHELAYKLYRRGWIVAYSDDVEYEHLGGSTYGVPGTKTISREEYQLRAKRFAFEYFLKTYGPHWPSAFWSAAQGHGIKINTFHDHYQLWSTAFSPEELDALLDQAPRDVLPTSNRHMQFDQRQASSPIQLNLDCGTQRREGWVNVDEHPQFAPDIVSVAHQLSMLQDNSCALIESCHHFAHLTLGEARSALKEWRRLLIPGGTLHLELPNLSRCLELIGNGSAERDSGLVALFGDPQEVEREGTSRQHKWGWTPESLELELRAAGFENVEQVSVSQPNAAIADRACDMRLVGRVADTLAHPSIVHDSIEVLAWPRYDDQAELDHFFRAYAAVLCDRENVTLSLRVDPQLDPPQAQVLAALEGSHARVLGVQAPLNISLLEGPMSAADWRVAGQRMVCRIRCTNEAAPRDAICQAPTPIVADSVSLLTLVNEGQVTANSSAISPASSALSTAPVTEGTSSTQAGVVIPAGVQPNAAVLSKIETLHPWFYPVEIDGMRVIPGLGSECAPEWYVNRTACRSTILVGEVLQRIDFRGKSLLDLACNCGFWSAFYAQAGARSLLGMEGRAQYLQQAELYWEHNKFLAADQVQFLPGNIADAEDWKRIRERGTFDVTLIAGILYHVPNYPEILKWASEVTQEVIIVDTRVQDGTEQMVTEPNNLAFNAIAETRDKIVPDRTRLLETLRSLGFEPEVMPVGFGRGVGVDDVDNYSQGARITIVARKVAVPAPAQVAGPQLSSGRAGGLR